jgi:hypothetical protein
MSESTKLNDDANALCYHQQELAYGVSVSCFNKSLNRIKLSELKRAGPLKGRNCWIADLICDFV